MWRVVWLGLATGCRSILGFDPAVSPDVTDPDSMTADSNGPPVAPLHLAVGDAEPGSGQVALTGTITIDTGIPMLSVSLPVGDSFDLRPQLGGGPMLAVLHVGDLIIESSATIEVRGPNPLVIVAGGSVEIHGVLDIAGHSSTPGAGGESTGGSGKGVPGSSEVANQSDSGGGGAGYGQGGAAGGDITGSCTVIGGAAGSLYGDPTIATLVGGSAGGKSSGTQCASDPGGAGGGALQISSGIRIAVTGVINAGGGGGHGGTDCGMADVNSGTGGGSGGSIVLQAPSITNAGTIAANGGGGGGSSMTGSGTASSGEDGHPDATAALGGVGPRATGGAGGTLGASPGKGGAAACGANAAGGGGGVGRIAVSSSYADTGTTSPAPDTSLPK